MATKTDTTLFPTNVTDADFRGWVQWVEDLLVTTGGWVVTGDTGQMTISTATHPTLTNTKVGYRFYRMNDALQGTYPVFLKMFFGSGANANNPGIWFAIGTGSDGAGNITGVLYDSTGIASPAVETGSSTVAAGTYTGYGSADSGRFCFMLWTHNVTSYSLVLGIERTVNASGTRTGDGLLVAWSDNTSTNHQYVAYTGSQPPTETGWHYILGFSNPSSFGADLGVGILLPMKGIVQQPGTQFCCVRTNDFTAKTSFAMSIYGVSHTYQCGDVMPQPRLAVGSGPGAVIDSVARIAIQYE